MTTTANSTQAAAFAGVPVQITNSLAVAIDIYDVFNPASAGQVAPYQYTKLGSIAAGKSGSVTTIRQVAQLAAMITGPIAELQGWYYYQFPIKLMSGTQFSFDNPPPLAYTVADADRKAMVQSFLFHKFAMANPDSALTKNLNTALKSTDPKAINAFFAGTQNFKECTLSSWNAVMTWLTMFTSGWQGPYYLYEAAPNPLPAGYAPTLIGTLDIVSSADANSATLALCTQDASGKLQALAPPQRSTVGMVGDGTMANQNPGQDVSLSLTPVWMNVIQTSMDNGKPTTSYLSGPTLTGTVAGQKVVSTQTLIPLPSQQDKSKKSSSSSSQTFGTLCQVVGLIVGLVMLYEMAEKRFGSKEAAKEDAKADAKSESDFQDKAETIDQATATENADTFNQNAETIDTDASGVADGYAQTSRTQQGDVLSDTIANERETLGNEINEQLEDGMTPSQDFETAYQDTLESFKTAQEQIDAGNPSEASTTMSDAAGSMQKTIDQSASDMQQSEVDALQNSADAVDAAHEQAEALETAQAEHETDMENADTDSGYEDSEPPETEEIPEGL